MSVQRLSTTVEKLTTAQSFVKFTAELVTFGLLDVLGVEWEYPHCETKGSRFEEIVGHAACTFRERHEVEFAQNIAAYHVFVLEDVDTTLEYLREFVRKTFKGRVPLMEFITYCAFLVDITVCCHEEGMLSYIEEIVEETYDVYEQHMKSYFHVIGGWGALGDVARQYVNYVEAMNEYSALEGSTLLKNEYSALDGSKETGISVDEQEHSVGNGCDGVSTERNGANDHDENDSNSDSDMDVSSNGAKVEGEIITVDDVAADDEQPTVLSEGVKASHTSTKARTSVLREMLVMNVSADGNDSNADSNMDVSSNGDMVEGKIITAANVAGDDE